MKNDPVLFSSNYCHCEGAGYAEVSSAPILNSFLVPGPFDRPPGGGEEHIVLEDVDRSNRL